MRNEHEGRVMAQETGLKHLEGQLPHPQEKLETAQGTRISLARLAARSLLLH